MVCESANLSGCLTDIELIVDNVLYYVLVKEGSLFMVLVQNVHQQIEYRCKTCADSNYSSKKLVLAPTVGVNVHLQQNLRCNAINLRQHSESCFNCASEGLRLV